MHTVKNLSNIFIQKFQHSMQNLFKLVCVLHTAQILLNVCIQKILLFMRRNCDTSMLCIWYRILGTITVKKVYILCKFDSDYFHIWL